MTVQTTTSRADYTGNGSTTAFTVPFYFLDNTHIKVLRTQISTGAITTLMLTTDYTVTGAGVGAGGTVTTVVAPTSDQKISILRNVPLTQLTHYVPNDPFPAASHEQALDLLTMEVQQINEITSRSLAFSANTSGVSAVLPTPVANYILGFDASAASLQLYSPASLLSVAGSSGFIFQTFNGDNSTTVFNLSAAPGAIGNLEVFVGGVIKIPTTDYTITGSTLTFTVAPAAGTKNIYVRWGQTLGIGVPSDTSVTTAKLVDSNVTYAKIQNISATSKILGRKTAAAGVAEECSLSDILDFIGSAAQGDILYRGSSVWARLAAGTSGQALITGGAGANPAWGSAGNLVLLSTQSASASSSIDFTSSISSTYKRYQVQITNMVISAASANLHLLTSANAGVSFDTGAANYGYDKFQHNGSSGISGGSSVSDTKIQMTDIALQSTDVISGTVELYDPAGTSVNHAAGWHLHGTDNGGSDAVIFGSGRRLSTSAVNGVRFIMSTGNITSGMFKLYGVL